MESLEKGLSREEIIERVTTMITGANPDFSKTEVKEMAEQTADQYLAERDDGVEPIDI